MCLLAALLGACQPESFIDDLSTNGTVAFSVSEGIADFSTKSVSAPAEAIVLRSAKGDSLILEMTQDLIPEGLLQSSSAQTKAKIYRNGDETPLQGDPFAVWCYRLTGMAQEPKDGIPRDLRYLVKETNLNLSYPLKAKYDNKKYWRPVDNNDEFKDIHFTRENDPEIGWFARWYALAPWSVTSATNIVINDIDNGKNPTLTYTVTDGSVDLMAAVSDTRKIMDEYSKVTPPVELTFGHVMTAVRFKKDNDPNTSISRLKIEAVFNKGTLDIKQIPRMEQLPPRSDNSKLDATDFQTAFLAKFSEDNLKGTAPLWNLDKSSVADYTITLDPVSDWTSQSPTDRFAYTTGDDHVLMLMPQWLPHGATIEATVNGEPYEGTISGHYWLPGRMVTYRIKKAAPPTNYSIEIENELNDLSDYENGNGAIVKVIADNPNANTEWKIEGVYHDKALAEHSDLAVRMTDLIRKRRTTWEGGTRKNGNKVYVDFSSVNGNIQSGSYSSEELMKVSVCAGAEDEGDRVHGAIVRGTPEKPWNLSNPAGGDKIVESANTYIINDPGWYRFPLVVGNGIVKGHENTKAFSPDNFKDYHNQSIVNPWLHKTSSYAGTPTSAFVVWEEEKVMTVKDETDWELPDGCISGNATDGYWLSFEIDEAHIKPGCAVIAVKDASGVVMWSWTLWVTDYEPGFGNVNCGDEYATFMPRNLGWTVTGTMPAVPKEQVYVRVHVADNPDVFAVITVRRPTIVTSTPTTGHGPFYQWGRKDAMIPSTGTGNNNLTTYGLNNSFSAYGGSDPLYTVGELLRHPEYCVINNTNPILRDMSNFNWWCIGSADGDDKKTVKTIYDPCPAGFAVPRKNAFLRFRKDNTGSQPNVSGVFDKGYWFYSGNGGGDVIYFPAAGYRANNGGTLNNVNTQGRYATAACRNNDSGTQKLGFIVDFRNNYINPNTNVNMVSMSFSVRPAKTVEE